MSAIGSSIRNKPVTVMGLGKFGGGIGAAKYLVSKGASVTVTDLKTAEELSDSLAELEGLGIRFVLGRHDMKDMTETAMLVVSPAVPRESAYIAAARRAGVTVTTEISLFVEQCPVDVCGITGTNGKSTTVSMLGSIFKKSGFPHMVGGNIGGSLLSELDSITTNHKVALELSSFQIEWLSEMRWSPHIAAVLNVMPNHLDRHGTFENYLEAKASILDNQKTHDVTVLLRDNAVSRSLSDRGRARIVWVGEDLSLSGFTIEDGNLVIRKDKISAVIMKASEIRIPGAHNVINALTAAACAYEMGIDIEAIARGIASFKGLPHRMEFVGEWKGISFYNDSKATTPDSTEVGVLAFDTPVIPILGGYDKGISFDGMAKRIAGRVQWAALIGATAPALSSALKNAGIQSDTFASLEEAFAACASKAAGNDTVILTPACASYDMFTNYEERGNLFRTLVSNLV